jgi:hypothetical protein
MKYKIQRPLLVFIWFDKGINITIRLQYPIARIRPDVSSIFWQASKTLEQFVRNKK